MAEKSSFRHPEIVCINLNRNCADVSRHSRFRSRFRFLLSFLLFKQITASRRYPILTLHYLSVFQSKNQLLNPSSTRHP